MSSLIVKQPIKSGRIRVLKIEGAPPAPDMEIGEALVFITVSAGETHVSILDGEGTCFCRWVSMFGWSFLFSLPIHFEGRTVTLDDEETLARALEGKSRIFGKMVDVSEWISAAGTVLASSLDEIMDRTIGTGAHYSGIVLSAPDWLHGVMAEAVALRPHIQANIRKI